MIHDLQPSEQLRTARTALLEAGTVRDFLAAIVAQAGGSVTINYEALGRSVLQSLAFDTSDELQGAVRVFIKEDRSSGPSPDGPWWYGRCREIAEETNLMANPPKEHEVTPWQVEQILMTAEAVRRRG